MAVLALAHAARPETLAAAVLPSVERTWPLRVEQTAWGSLAFGGCDTGRTDRWLVAGKPQAHPWSKPGDDVPLDEAAARFDRFGPEAVQLFSGPFVAVDLQQGAAVRPLSGAVPLHAAPGAAAVVATLPGVVRELAGSADPVAPGHVACTDGTLRCGGLDDLDRGHPLSWAGVRAEIEEHLRGLVDRRLPGRVAVGPAAGPPLDDVVADPASGYLLWLPSLPGDGDGYLALRARLPAVWSAARWLDRWLLAPAFERPALDLAALAGVRP